ncbi:hypothetical protein ES703_24101 [subsurface metagenome]
MAPFQPIARTTEDSENKEQPTEKAIRSLITPIFIILTVTWLALFSYLQVASIDLEIKNVLASRYLEVLTSQIFIFMAAIIPATMSYFAKEFSLNLKKISYGFLVITLVSTPAPLAATLATIGNNPDIYIFYLILACVAIFFLIVPAFPRREKKVIFF